MGTINFRTLTNKGNLALVNDPDNTEVDFYDFIFDEIQEKIYKQNFYYFDLFIKNGYYDGFCLCLEEANTKWIYQNSKEKAEVVEELTEIESFLVTLIKSGTICGQHPGWVPSFLTTQQTILELKAIIKELKEKIKASYTERTAKGKSIFDIMEEERKQQ